MEAIQLKRFGIENLELVNIAKPSPQSNEVSVRMTAAALQYLDLVVINGTIAPNLSLPHIPVSEGAGVVESVGDGVAQWKSGDRVIIHFIQKWTAGKINAETNAIRTGLQTQGTLTEYMIVPEYALVRSPENLTDEEAATLSVSGLTAWANLVTNAGIQAGQTVLTQGSGGVSLFALQIAKAFGAKVIATSGTDEKLGKLKSLGAQESFNYKKHPEWNKEVRRLNGGEGVDITIDVTGSDSIAQSILSCKEHGYVGVIGLLTGEKISFDIFLVNMQYIRLQGYSVGNIEDFENLVHAVEVNNIKPVIDSVYPMEKVQEAFKHMVTGNHFGKIVIKL